MKSLREQLRSSSGLLIRIFPFLCVVATVLLVPFRILSRGYLPGDDVLRHAAFAVSNRSWSQILVGRPEAIFDQSPGWHLFLKSLHLGFGMDAEALAAFSIVALLVLFTVAGLAWVKHWEAWLLSLLLVFLADPGSLIRYTLGRPFLLTTVFCILVLGAVRNPATETGWRWRHGAFLLGASVCTWAHGSWYLLFLPAAALLAADRIEEALRVGAVILPGAFLGAALTGHPWSYLTRQILHLFSAMGRPTNLESMAGEFQPVAVPIAIILLLGLAYIFSRERMRTADLRHDAVLWMGILGCLLGFSVQRFYSDFGLPALALWLALRLDGMLEDLSWMHTLRRIGFSVLVCASFFLVCTANLSERWSRNAAATALDASRPELAGWLPEPGGILYAVQMQVYYQTFFRNPDAPWRYILGHEPAMMNPEDLRIIDQLNSDVNLSTQVAPWIQKMTPRDRLVYICPPGTQGPRRPGLEWTFVAPDKWIGRKPR